MGELTYPSPNIDVFKLTSKRKTPRGLLKFVDILKPIWGTVALIWRHYIATVTVFKLLPSGIICPLSSLQQQNCEKYRAENLKFLWKISHLLRRVTYLTLRPP